MKAKTIITTTIISIVGIIICNNHVSALEYSSSAGINFTINPSISVSVSGDLIIDELAPGSSQDSNIITVAVATNSLAGYHLSTTVGTSNTNYTDLRLNSNDNTNKFTNLTTNKASLANFNDNTWGYSYSTDSGTTWISGNIGSTVTGYNGLPLDNNDSGTTGITLIDTEESTSTNPIQFKIGAKASNVQAAGEYTNTINFYAVTYQEPLSLADSYAAAGKIMYNGYYKMQDMSPAICATATEGSELRVIDIRDNNDYSIAKINGHCWMTQNLRITHTENQPEGTILGQGSNFNANSIVFDGDLALGNNYVKAYYHIPTNLELEASSLTTNEIGVYYNFCAASAKSGDGACSENEAYSGSENICPANWTLPTSNQIINITNNTAIFSPIYGGFYDNGVLNYPVSRGNWWSSTAYGPGDQYVLRHINSQLEVGGWVKYVGRYIRCVVNS